MAHCQCYSHCLLLSHYGGVSNLLDTFPCRPAIDIIPSFSFPMEQKQNSFLENRSYTIEISLIMVQNSLKYVLHGHFLSHHLSYWWNDPLLPLCSVILPNFIQQLQQILCGNFIFIISMSFSSWCSAFSPNVPYDLRNWPAYWWCCCCPYISTSSS